MDPRHNEQLDKFIRERKKLGHGDVQIMSELRQAGWKEDDISSHVSDVQSSPQKSGVAWFQDGTRYGFMAFFALIAVAAVYWVLWDAASVPWGRTNTNGSDGVIYSRSGSLAEQLAAQSSLKKFNNYRELGAFLEANAASADSGYGYDALGVSGFRSDVMIEEAPTSTLGPQFGLGTAELDSAQKSDDYSTTNIQVEGVDEADIVKTDGKYVYVVSKQNVFIVDAFPADSAKILSTIVLESTPQDIFINGDSLIIYGQDDLIYEQPVYDLLPRPSSSYTFLKVFDVSDPVNPTQERDLEFEGWATNARMIGDYVYFVTSNSAIYYDDAPVPLILEDGKALSTEPGVARCNCPDVWYIDAPYQSYAFTSVAAINVKDNAEAVASDVYLTNSAENLYMSQENLYLVYTKYVSEWQLMYESMREVAVPMLSAKDQDRIREIDAASSTLLNDEEKQSKVYEIIGRYLESLSESGQETIQNQVDEKLRQKYTDISKELEKTVIHKISVDGSKLNYEGSGEVTGHVLNQFSMDERDGYFRIATTRGQTWMWLGTDEASQKSYSNVYVLDGDLNVVGKVEGLAEDEQIYSARFMQGRVYLVTFRQVDPLFVIDLKDPRNPQVIGQLKVPGFSSYLHPYDDQYLIGFGKQADTDGRVKGLKVSLFDVSDPDSMREVDTYEMGDAGSTSYALDDHKAFLFSKEKNLLVVPVVLYESAGDNIYGSVTKSSAMVFSVTPEGIELKGQIDHSDGTADDNNRVYWYGYDYYDTTVKRSLYIENTLYTLSDKYLKMHGLGDLGETKSLTLTASGDDYTIIKPSR